MKVLHSSYQVPFHHLTLVSGELWKFSSYSSGFVEAQTLQEVDKMLVKGALEVDEHLKLGYYSLLSWFRSCQEA